MSARTIAKVAKKAPVANRPVSTEPAPKTAR